ncbi:MAG: GYD domain-containing protein [Candidatus Bathyarchaeota archaeon]|nr:GYD domain-containing protein [Candidatus Bathyarchaeota archaeon]
MALSRLRRVWNATRGAPTATGREVGDNMIFITLWTFRQKATKEMLAESVQLAEQLPQEGITIIGNYWTLGKCDLVTIAEAKNEQTFMNALLRYGHIFATETLVALNREDAIKLVSSQSERANEIH